MTMICSGSKVITAEKAVHVSIPNEIGALTLFLFSSRPSSFVTLTWLRTSCPVSGSRTNREEEIAISLSQSSAHNSSTIMQRTFLRITAPAFLNNKSMHVSLKGRVCADTVRGVHYDVDSCVSEHARRLQGLRLVQPLSSIPPQNCLNTRNKRNQNIQCVWSLAAIAARSKTHACIKRATDSLPVARVWV